MSGKRKRLYYKLTPIFEPDPSAPPMIANAAIVTCIATGQMLSGYGGGADALSPEIVDQLDMRKTGGSARVICDAETFDEMTAALKEAELQIDYMHGKFQTTGTGETTLFKIRSALAKASPTTPRKVPDPTGSER